MRFFRCPANRDSLPDVEWLFRRKRALGLWQEGQRLYLEGEFEGAKRLYEESIAVLPTAEAHTFRAWALSAENRLEDAIAECRKAIEVDPSFGNPYNDLGSYLMVLGRADEAIEWLERAKKAPRYEPRHFPYINLGRLYAAKGLVRRAISEFEGAQRLCPGDESCATALNDLRTRVN